jgi:hypothetical protein
MYHGDMAKKKKSTDVNVIAHDILQALTGEPLQTTSVKKATPEQVLTKNPAAVALGRLGGLKGGKARARKLSPAKRVAIAKKAAKARWKPHKPKG